MNIAHTQIDHHLYEIKLQQTPNFSQDILPLLEQHASWTIHESKAPDGSPPRRIGDFENQHNLLDKYESEFVKSNIKEQLCEILSNNEIFVSLHKEKTKDWLMTNTNFFCSYYKVFAEYGLDNPHVDQPIGQTLALGLIYFMHENDPGRSTIFRDWSNRHNIVVNTGYQLGWWMINSPRSFHQICNTSKHDRYGLKLRLDVS
jgi:hypothetical protein